MSSSKRLLVVLVGVVLGVLAGSIAWGASEGTRGDAAASGVTPTQAAAVIDKLLASQSAGNVNAAIALYTRDAVVWQDGETQASGTAQIRKHTAEAKPSGYSAKRIAPVIVHGNFATTYESAKAAAAGSWLGLGVYQFRGGLIAGSWEFILKAGGGGSQPFTNAR